MTADYLVFARDSSNNLIGQVDDFETLTLNPRFNDVGSWAMTLDANSDKAALFEAGTGIVVYRKPSGGSWAVFFSGPLGAYQPKGGASGDTLTLGGPDDNTVLADRLCQPTHGYPYEALILADGATRFYRLGTGTLVDAAGSGHDLSAIGGVVYTTNGLIDDPDGCVHLDGSTGYLAAATTGLPTGNSAWSLEAWVYLAALNAATSHICGFGTQGTHQAAGIYLDATGKAHASTYSADTGTPSNGALSLNTAHHIVGTWDGTNLKCYVDGALVATATPGTASIGTAHCYIGMQVNGANNFGGFIDEVAMYSTTLSATTITNHYNYGVSRFAGDTNEQSGYGKAGDGIWAYIDVNVGPDADGVDGGDSARVNSELSVGTTPDLGDYIQASARFDNLLELCRGMAVSGGDIGFRVLQSGTGLSLTIYTPSDKTSNAKFSRDLGNLLDYDYSLSRPKANYVYVLGGGQGTARKIMELGDSTSISDWGRIEGSVDARDTSDLDTMYARGSAYLDQNKSQVNFSCTAIDTDTCTFGADYDLGDKVKIWLPDGTTISDLVREVKIELTRGGGEDIKIGIGNPGNGAILTPANAALRRVMQSHIGVATRVAQLERRY